MGKLFKKINSVSMGLVVLYILTTSQASGCGGEKSCSDNSSTYGFFYFNIACLTINQCPTPCDGGRLYFTQPSLAQWSISGSMSNNERFCIDYGRNNLSGPKMFQTKRPDTGTLYTCKILIKCGNANMQYVKSNADIGEWYNNSGSNPLYMGELFTI